MTRQPFTVLAGRAIPLMLTNVDTDVIIRVERMTSTDPAALAPWAFESLRYAPDGSERSDFVVNDPAYVGAPILLAGDNFGCGSSREPAVWALMGLGVQCVIAPSFGDIFRGNCLTNGVLPIALDRGAVEQIAALTRASGDGDRDRESRESHPEGDSQLGERGAGEVTIDLPAQSVSAGGQSWHFEIGLPHKLMLTEGVDEIGLALRSAERVADWEADDRRLRRWAWPTYEGERTAQ